MGLIKSWSYSKFKLYQQCPLKFKFIVIDRLKEPPTDALKKGVEIHSLVEDYLRNKVKSLPEEYHVFTPEFERLRQFFMEPTHLALAEEGWAFDQEWQPCEWNNFSRAWVRVKVDCLYSNDNPSDITVIDWKTGKFNLEYGMADYINQLELYALAIFIQIEHAEVVRPKLVFLDAKEVYPRDTSIVYHRKDVDVLKARWEAKVKPMFEDHTFNPHPSKLCKFCAFSKANGGDCPLDLTE